MAEAANNSFPAGRKRGPTRGSFKKGDPRINTRGRKKGVPNKFTRDIKEAVLNALQKLGGDNYLVRVGQRDMKAFAQLLGKAMPLTIEGGDKPLQTRTEVKVEFVDAPPKEEK